MPEDGHMKHRNILGSCLAAALTLSLASVPAAAAGEAPQRELLQPPKTVIPSPITDRFALRGTYHQPSVSSDLRYDSSAGLLGTELSAERDFGLDDRLNDGSLEMTLRMIERHRVRAEFFQLKRSAEQQLGRDVRFGDDTYLASDVVATDTDLRFLGLTYTYSFLRAERFELGAGLGLHLFQVDASTAVPARRLRENFDAAGPFPTIAVDGTYRVTHRFSVNARAQYFGTGVGDVDGSLGIYHADLQFRAWPNLAIGVGYTKTSLHVDSTDSDFTGRLFVDVKGPEIFLRASF